MKAFEEYRAVVESMVRLDLAENPIQPPRRPSRINTFPMRPPKPPAQQAPNRINTFPMRPPQPPAQQAPKQPLQEYEVPVRGKHGVYYRRQKVAQLRPGYRAASAPAPQTPTTPRKPTEEELSVPQQPPEEFVRRLARKPQAQPAEPPDAMQLALDDDDSEKNTGGSARMNPNSIREHIERLHDDFMQSVQDTTRVAAFGKGHLEIYQGHHDNLEWAASPAYRQAVGEIEKTLGHPMLLMGLLAGIAGAPTYLESRPGYGKTTMARAMKKRLDALYQRMDKDPSAARKIAEFPFADVLLVEPKTDVSELIGYLYVAGTHDPSRGTEHNPEVVKNLAQHLMQTHPGMTPEQAHERAQQMTTEAINIMTGGGTSGKTAYAPTSEVATALQRAALWRTPDGKMVKPILLWYDDAHSSGFLQMIHDRLKTSLAANVVYGMPYLRAYHILAANPNDASVAPEFASRLFPVIIPAGATIEFALRGHEDFDEHLGSVGRSIAEESVSRVLGKPYEEATQEEIERNKKAIQEKFREELNNNYAKYALSPRDKDKVLEKNALDYLSDGLGATHYEDAIGLAINNAGLDAPTAGWHIGAKVNEGKIFSTLLQTPGYAAAYSKDELGKIAERHAAFAMAIKRNRALMKQLILQTGEQRLEQWKQALAVLQQSGQDGIDWYNERSEAKSGTPSDQPMGRTPRDWQRLVDLSAMFLALGRPDMVLYTIGTTCGIKHETRMPEITMDSHPAQIDEAIRSYFAPDNLTPSAKERLRQLKMSPEQYLAGVSEFARAALFTTQLGGGAGEHTIYSITKPYIDTLIRQQQETKAMALGTDPQPKLPSAYTQTDEILPDTPWYDAHNADVRPHLSTLYRLFSPKDDAVRREAETAHAILGTLAGLMHSMHATGAIGTQERNAILRSAKHAVETTSGDDNLKKILKMYLNSVGSAARMAAALRRFANGANYDKLSEDDKRELHRFGHLVALAHAKLSNGDYALDENKRNEIRDLIETVHAIASTGSQPRAGGTAAGAGRFDPLVHTRWSAEFADALAKVLSS